jgi:quercetin dioxygenase-like cupin family protein
MKATEMRQLRELDSIGCFNVFAAADSIFGIEGLGELLGILFTGFGFAALCRAPAAGILIGLFHDYCLCRGRSLCPGSSLCQPFAKPRQQTETFVSRAKSISLVNVLPRNLARDRRERSFRHEELGVMISDVNLDNAPAFWFLNALHVLLTYNEATQGGYSLIHLTAPRGLETPYHLHHAEDEAFYLLEGALTVIRDGETIEAVPGSYIFLPRGVPHGFRASSDKDSKVLIHVIPGGKVGFVGMMLAMAMPIADRHKPPEATAADLKKLASLCEQNNISVLGPLPI